METSPLENDDVGVPAVQSTLHRFGWRRFVESAKGAIYEVAQGPQTTQLLHPYTCPLFTCGFQCSTAHALTSHVRWKHPTMPRLASSSRACTDGPPGNVVLQLLLDSAGSAGPTDEIDQGIPCDDVQEDSIVKLPSRKRIKLTKGAQHRVRHTCVQMLKALHDHDGELDLGAQPKDDDGRAVGTTVPYTTLFKWKPKLEMIEKQAAMEVKARLKVIVRHSSSHMRKFDHRVMKRLRKLRTRAFRVTTPVALMAARRVYQKITDEHGIVGWPLNPKHGRFKPTTRTMKVWLNIRKWKPRKPKNRRGHTPEQEAAIMTTWVSTLRCSLLQKPAEPLSSNPEDGWCPVKDRYNMDQVGVDFDLFSSGTTWATPEEAATGFVRIQGSGSGGDKRFGSLHLCLGCHLSAEQLKLLVILKLKVGLIQAEERAVYDSLDNVVVCFQRCGVVDGKVLTEIFLRRSGNLSEAKTQKGICC